MKNISLITFGKLASVVSFRIGAQTHRNESFGNRKDPCGHEDGFPEFKASNGITLSSFDMPEWRSHTRTLYVRGRMVDNDNQVIMATEVEYENIQAAVREYNHVFSKEEETLPAINYTLTDLMELVGKLRTDLEDTRKIQSLQIERIEHLENQGVELRHQLNARTTFPADYEERIRALESENDVLKKQIANLKLGLPAPEIVKNPPVGQIVWALVERDTPVWVKDDYDGPWEKRYFAKLNSDGSPLFYPDGDTSSEYEKVFKNDGFLIQWNHYSLEPQ